MDHQRAGYYYSTSRVPTALPDFSVLFWILLYSINIVFYSVMYSRKHTTSCVLHDVGFEVFIGLIKVRALLVFFAGSDRIHPQSNFGNSCFFCTLKSVPPKFMSLSVSQPFVRFQNTFEQNPKPTTKGGRSASQRLFSGPRRILNPLTGF